jgi:hypothetical protein
MNKSHKIGAPVVRGADARARQTLDLDSRLGPEVDWDDVQRAVADPFCRLAADVAVRLPGVRCRPGANRSPAVLLYAYSVFDLPDPPDPDPLVVGVSFKRGANGLLVRGDICGEESGKIYWAPSTCRLLVPQDAGDVLLAGSTVATLLAREIDALVNLLRRREPA